MEPTRPRHSMPNSLALWLLWVCRDLQVSDVLGRRQDHGLDRSARGLDAYQQPHPTPCRAVPRLMQLLLQASDVVLGVGVGCPCATALARAVVSLTGSSVF